MDATQLSRSEGEVAATERRAPEIGYPSRQHLFIYTRASLVRKRVHGSTRTSLHTPSPRKGERNQTLGRGPQNSDGQRTVELSAQPMCRRSDASSQHEFSRLRSLSETAGKNHAVLGIGEDKLAARRLACGTTNAKSGVKRNDILPSEIFAVSLHTNFLDT